MREILFRGKLTHKDEWVDGDLVQDMLENQVIASISGYSVEAETVGQYTGLTDKNGKSIFEGDIVKAFGMIGEIVQECGAFGIQIMPCIDYDLLECEIPYGNNANFCFNDNFISLWELWWNYQQDDEPLEVVEVVGNIHDSPELLKGDKNDPQSGMRQLQN